MSIVLIMVPLCIFLIFVAPLWLFFHYRSQRKSANGLTDEDFAKLQALVKKAETLQDRVTTLEKILDSESDNWRRHYGA